MFACRDPTLTKLAISAPQWLQTELHNWYNFHCTVCTDRFPQGSRLKHLFTNVRGVVIIYCTRHRVILNLYFSFDSSKERQSDSSDWAQLSSLFFGGVSLVVQPGQRALMPCLWTRHRHSRTQSPVCVAWWRNQCLKACVYRRQLY